MSNEPKGQHNISDRLKVDQSTPRPIAVAELRFCVPNGRDVNLPGSGGGFSVLQSGQRGGHLVDIEYKPWIRHHHVRFLDAKRAVVKEVMIHESWVSWTPAVEPGA